MPPTPASASWTDETGSVPRPPRPLPDRTESTILDLRDQPAAVGVDRPGPGTDGAGSVNGLLEARKGGSPGHRAEYGHPVIWLWRRSAGAAFAALTVLVAWYLVKLPDGLVSDRTFPSPGQVADAVAELRTSGFAGADLAGHLWASIGRLGFGLVAGLVVGLVLGLVMTAGPHFRTVVDPIVSFFRMVPAIAVAPFLLLWFGRDESTIVVVVALGVCWSMADQVATIGARRLRVLPVDSAHEIASGSRSVLLLAWATVLVLETVLAGTGLGALVWFAQARPDMMVAAIGIIALVGLAFDTTIRLAYYVVAGREPRRPVWIRTGPDPSAGVSTDRGGPDVIEGAVRPYRRTEPAVASDPRTGVTTPASDESATDDKPDPDPDPDHKPDSDSDDDDGTGGDGAEDNTDREPRLAAR